MTKEPSSLQTNLDEAEKRFGEAYYESVWAEAAVGPFSNWPPNEDLFGKWAEARKVAAVAADELIQLWAMQKLQKNAEEA